MGLSSGTQALGLVAAFLVLYVVLSIGYRRYLFQWLPDPSEGSPDTEESAGPGERHCPRCGTINDVDFAKCYECGASLPTEPSDG